jgi:hypothetical protein
MSDQTSGGTNSRGDLGGDVPQGNLQPGNSPANTGRDIGDRMPGRTGEGGGGAQDNMRSDPADVTDLGDPSAGLPPDDSGDDVAGRSDPTMDQDDDIGDDSGGGI